MKKVLFGLMIAAAFTACNNSAKTEEPKADSTTVAPVDTTAKAVDTTAAKVDTTAKVADTTKK